MSHFVYGNGSVRTLFLHGWFGDSNDFKQFFKAFDPTIFCFAAIDFRGYGSAKNSEGPFNLQTIAEDGIAVCDSLGWEQFSVVGHSMGGKAALKTATLVPDRIQRICGIAPVWAGRANFDEQALGQFRRAKEIVSVREAIIRRTTGGRLPAYWSQTVADRSMEISQARAFADYFESWALEDFSIQAEQLANETLAIIGRFDPGISEEIARATWLARLPNVKLVILPDASHYPIDECPLTLAATISAFLVNQ
jgi:pimeloyl-ACP methyl ester carboxylesterase